MDGFCHRLNALETSAHKTEVEAALKAIRANLLTGLVISRDRLTAEALAQALGGAADLAGEYGFCPFSLDTMALAALKSDPVIAYEVVLETESDVAILSANGESVVGRSAQERLLPADRFPHVSRRHLTVRPQPDGAGWLLYDHSAQGTYVQGERVPAETKIPMMEELRFVLAGPTEGPGYPAVTLRRVPEPVMEPLRPIAYVDVVILALKECPSERFAAQLSRLIALSQAWAVVVVHLRPVSAPAMDQPPLYHSLLVPAGVLWAEMSLRSPQGPRPVFEDIEVLSQNLRGWITMGEPRHRELLERRVKRLERLTYLESEARHHAEREEARTRQEGDERRAKLADLKAQMESKVIQSFRQDPVRGARRTLSKTVDVKSIINWCRPVYLRVRANSLLGPDQTQLVLVPPDVETRLKSFQAIRVDNGCAQRLKDEFPRYLHAFIRQSCERWVNEQIDRLRDGYQTPFRLESELSYLVSQTFPSAPSPARPISSVLPNEIIRFRRNIDQIFASRLSRNITINCDNEPLIIGIIPSKITRSVFSILMFSGVFGLLFGFNRQFIQKYLSEQPKILVFISFVLICFIIYLKLRREIMEKRNKFFEKENDRLLSEYDKLILEIGTDIDSAYDDLIKSAKSCIDSQVRDYQRLIDAYLNEFRPNGFVRRP